MEGAMPSDVDAQRERLIRLLAGFQSCAVAYSGGVDSAVVAQAACVALGERAVAVTAVSPSLAAHERQLAQQLARRMGIRHLELPTSELDNSLYVRNAPDRCYHCKTELYRQLLPLAKQLGLAVVVNGTNADDLADVRPGMRAANERGVRSPLAECGLAKSDVRRLAAAWQLPVWDKPASPCLSSRVAYGEHVTPERLAMIEKAELYLRRIGPGPLRVRYHRGDLARVEVPLDTIQALCVPSLRAELVREFKAIGFKAITLDLEGFRSGNLHELVNLEP
jgi:uncharacterized protein